MKTTLRAVSSRWPAEALEGVIPPACRGGVDPAAAPHVQGDRATIELPVWRLRPPARQLLPTFSVLTAREYSFRFEMSVLAGGAWSPWVAAASLGPLPFAPLGGSTDAVTADIDVFLAPRPVKAVRLQLRLAAPDPRAVLEAPWFVALSASDGEPAAAGPWAPPAGVNLAVPPFSQMTMPSDVRMRICSPVSVAMVLGYFGRQVDAEALAAEMYHPGVDRYGVWPAAVMAAGRRGLGGYLLRFPDWESAAWCLRRGIPIVASVRYGPGELAGAAIAETAGHLVVLTGYEDDDVLVNDPAAPGPAAVARRYRRQELGRVWLERAGVGYVLFAPAR